MGPPSCMRSVVDRNAVMRRMTVVSVLSVTDSIHAILPPGGGGELAAVIRGNTVGDSIVCWYLYYWFVTVVRNAKDRGTDVSRGIDDPQTFRTSSKEKIERPTPVTTGQAWNGL